MPAKPAYNIAHVAGSGTTDASKPIAVIDLNSRVPPDV
jgi:hypothetical protein